MILLNLIVHFWFWLMLGYNLKKVTKKLQKSIKNKTEEINDDEMENQEIEEDLYQEYREKPKSINITQDILNKVKIIKNKKK